MTANLIIQYIIVGLILAGIVVWVGIRLYRIRKRGKIDSCCGCSLSGACGKKNILRKNGNKDCCS